MGKFSKTKRLVWLLVTIITTPFIHTLHAQGYIKVHGNQLINSQTGEEIFLKGVCFGNRVWNNGAPQLHHEAVDYKVVKNLGMNTVRFYLNYQTFENDSAPYQYANEGWDWLDKNIAWAKKHGIYLLLNMHVPQGGFQSNGAGGALWRDTTNQQRLIKLWSAIANRYKNEPTIAGYDLLNEPVVTQSKSQWQHLATALVTEIRKVDNNHMIVVERLNAVNRTWGNDEEMNFFKLEDNNILYEFHFYHPFQYTHQKTSWTGLGDGGSYPDSSKTSWPQDLKWSKTTEDNPKILTGSRDWAYYEGKPFQVLDSSIVSLKPALEASKTGTNGAVFFGNFFIKEYDSSMTFLRNVMIIEAGDSEGWQFWSKDGKGSMKSIDNFTANNKAALRITATESWANAYNNKLRFSPTIGHYYQINGWAKPEMVAWEATSKFKIDMETSPSGGISSSRNKQDLEQELLRYISWAEKQNVPLFLGEFGLYKACFKGKKGGIQWVEDVLDLCQKHKLHFTYHAYNEDAFGIFDGSGPQAYDSRPNKKLINLFKSKLAPSK